jgi:competence protein ComEC
MKRRPLLALAAGFALGAALPGQSLPALPLAAGASLLALSPPLAPLAFFFAGWVTAAATRVPPSRIAPEVRVLEGRVASVPERFEGDVRFLLRTADRGLVLVTAPALPWPIALGDRLRLEARLRAPEGRRNPGGRDRAAELAARGVALEAHATSPPVRLARPSPLAWLELGRSRFAAAADAGLPPREAGLVRAIGSGDRGGVDAATTEAFVRSGLAHLLSVSGLHLAVVALGAWRLLRALLVRSDRLASRLDPRRAAVLAALPLTLLYAIGTGADVPVVRSALAAALGFGAVLCDREVDALGAVALAALAVLAVEPGALLDPSFQLSFASVAGLALGSGPLRAALPIPVDREGWPARLREALLGSACASAAATLATAPIVAFHFRRLSLLAIASNVAGVPIGSALTVAAALAAAAASIAPFATAPLLLACHGLASLLLAVNDAFAAPPWAVVGVGSPGLAGCAVCYLALLVAWRGRGWLRLAAALVAALALLGVPPLRHALAMHRGGLEAVFLGVGQGDATAFLLPDGSAVLVDGGGEARGRSDPGARDLVPWLRDAGIRRLSAVFLSHPHPDHLLGLVAVARALPIERFFTNGRSGDDLAAEALRALPPATVLRRGEVFDRAGVRFEALGPPPGSEAWTENDASLVLRVVHGQVRFLLCGDVEREGGAALLAFYPGDLGATVLKVPHHGSPTSSGPAFVAATRPEFAVMTLGRDNRFGFPAPEVVARWRAAGSLVLRTDDGAVRFLSDGRSVRRTPAAISLDTLALAQEHP